MKYKLLNALRSPNTGEEFDIEVFEEKKVKYDKKYSGSKSPLSKIKNKRVNFPKDHENIEIISGILKTKKGEIYPIVKGIPRILPNAIFMFPDFYERFKEKIGKKKISQEELKKFKKLYRQTQKAFEFQWKTFGNAKKIYGRDKSQIDHHFIEEMSSKKINWKWFNGKLVTEGGSGHGTYVQIVAEHGGECIGMDLGLGAEIAYDKCRHLPNAHFVQTNLMFPPLKKEAFDYVYSLGVIHHTPDTRKSFDNLAKLVKKNGRYSIWLYPLENKFAEIMNSTVRAVTTKLPPKVLYHLCYIPVPLLTFVRPYSGTHLGRNTWKECVECLYDWLSPRYQTHHTPEELCQWFKEEGFKVEEIFDLKTGAIGIKKK